MKINVSALAGHAFITVACTGPLALLGYALGNQVAGACLGAGLGVMYCFYREGVQVHVAKAATLEAAREATHSEPFAVIPAALSNANSALQAAVSIPVAALIVAMAATL